MMSEVEDFDAFVSLYEKLKRRYNNLPEKGTQTHDIFEMNYLECESGAWIPSFIKNKREGKVAFRFGRTAVEYAVNALFYMECDLNSLDERR